MAEKRTSTTTTSRFSNCAIRKCPISKKHANFLRALLYLEGRQRIALLNSVNRDFIKCICECVLNILKGNVELKPSEKNRLKKHVRLMRLLVYKRKNKNKKKIKQDIFKGKKKLLVQHGRGGFLPALLAPIIAAVLNKFL